MNCRCCGQNLPDKPIFVFENMPKSAQFFPDMDEASTEKGIDLHLFECPFCGVLQLSGDPVPYYREVIRATRVSPEMHEFRVGQFGEWLDKYKLRDKKVLEVGCGSGEFMDMMKEAGANVYGVEYGEENIRAAKSLGHKVWQMFLDDEKKLVPEGKYDAFYCLSFIEHNPNPGVFLRSVWNNLKDDGVGLVEAPDMDMVLRENMYSEFIQDHLLYFTKDSLKRLLEWNGFDVLNCSTVWHGYVISAQVRKRAKSDLSGFSKKRESTRDSVTKFLSEAKKDNSITAVWGAGHQALANLSLLSMSKYVDYIIDSAPFKQNKLTPATHIPILPPSAIEEKNIGAVLVMAGSYSTEICRILRKDFPSVKRGILENDGVTLDE